MSLRIKTARTLKSLFALISATFLACLMLLPSQTSAQSKSNKGTDFWLAYMRHFSGTSTGHSLYITGDSATTGTVSVPGQSWSQNFTVTANAVTVVTIPQTIVYDGCSDCKITKAVNVTAAKDVVVYSHQYLGNQSDATLVLPTRTLGKEYYTVGVEQRAATNNGRGNNVFAIVAVKDNTKVKITPSNAVTKNGGGTLPANTPYEITLNKNEFYQGVSASNLGASSDLTGTRIEVIDTGATADCRTIAVFSGSSYSPINSGCSGTASGDNLYEQMYPTSSWGTRFVLVPALGRSGDNFRFIASEDNTQVIAFRTSGPPDIYYLDAGEFAQIDIESNVRNVVTTKPIMVAQYQRTARCDGNNTIGDPSMTILNPLEQTLTDITVYSSSFFDIDNHYINVVIPAWAASSFRIDGNSATFTGVPGNTQYSYARLSVSAGNHRLKADGGFIATAYGEGQYESYGYAAGANVKDLTAVASVTNSAKNTEISNCIGRPTVFSGTAEYVPVGWLWNFDDGTTSTLQNPTHLFTDTGLYEVKMYAYKPTFDGCQSFDSSIVEVRIYGKPEARISHGNICDSNTVLFTENSIFPTPETYLTTKWSIDAGPFSYGRTRSEYFDTTGKFEVFMEVTTANGCRDTILDSLVVNPLPEPSFTKTNACFYDSSVFNNTSTVVSGSIVLHSWELTGAPGTTGANPTFFIPNEGWSYISYTAITDSGCFATVNDSVYKHPAMDVSFSYNDTCLGFANTFTNTTALDGGVYTDTAWYISTLDTAYTFNYANTFGIAGDVTVQLVMEQDNFCRDTFIQTVTIHPLVVPNFSFSETCFGDSTVFTDLSAISSGSFTRNWSFDDGLFGTEPVQKVGYASSGIKSVTLTLTSDNDCVADTTFAVVITNPEITALNLVDGCNGSSQNISSTNVLGLDSLNAYTWTVDGNIASSDSMFNYTSTSDGFIVVNLDVVSKNGCSISRTDSFESFTSPSANFFINSVCNNTNLMPTDNSNINAPSVITGYTWFVDGVQVSTNQNPSIPTTLAGNKTVKYRVESNNGCKDSIQKQVVVHPLPIAGFSSQDLCFGDNSAFTSTATVASGSITGTEWLIDASSLSGNMVNYQFPTVSTYSVQQIVITDRNCRDTIVSDVVVNPLPIINADLDETEGCEPFTISTTNTSTIAGSNVIANYLWEWGDGNTAIGDEPTHEYASTGSYTIKVIGTSDKGCKDSITLGTPVTVFTNPRADFYYTPDDPSNLTDFVTFVASSSTDAVMWDWTITDGGAYSGESINHPFADSGTYGITLLVANENGCEDEITKFLYVNADLFVHIPNAFSPNGDFVNDTYGLGGLTQGVAKLKMTIYNRWGEQIFYSEDVNDRWDGTYKGAPAQQGVYVYMIQFTNPKQTKWYYYNGEINLLR